VLGLFLYLGRVFLQWVEFWVVEAEFYKRNRGFPLLDHFMKAGRISGLGGRVSHFHKLIFDSRSEFTCRQVASL
jgi:hypothetical protein